ncbi:hypothetical protein JOM56_008774 [Amanita muscaria]
MLGARTKQVNSYGKRAQRVVNASDERRPQIPNIFDEPEAPIQWAPVASRMRKRENVDKSRTSSTTSSSSSPRIIHVQRRKALISPVRRKKVAALTAVREPSLPRHSPDEPRGSDDVEKCFRPPLATHSINIPSSPVIANCKSKRITPKAKKRLHKPVPDVVEVDIILLDEDGTTIAKERRLSHTKTGTKRNVQSKARKPPLDSSSDSEDKPAAQPRQKGLKRQATVRRIVSDDSDSEASPVELVTPAAKLPDSPVISDINVAQCQRSQQSQDIRSYASQSKSITSYASSQQPTRLQTSSLQSSDRYTHVPSPIIHQRPLTPIRGLRTARSVVPQLPPSPTDFDSSIDLSDLDLGLSEKYIDSTIPEYLKPLLQECHQEECGLYEFSSFIKSFPYDPIIRSSLVDDNTDHGFKKIGEASYSEVFGIGDVVLKIIPLRKETPRQSGAKSNGYELEDPATSDARDVRREIVVTRAMGQVCDGFVKLLKAYVVRGRYPDLLLKLWDEYNEARGSESIRPDTFTVSQVYAIIVLPNGGPDLEAYTFTSAGKTGWRQACSIFWQVSKALAHAEQLVSFEHRDLHWGQILVKDLSNDCLSKLKNLGITSFMDNPAHGVQATIIDLGLSRMDASDSNGLERVYWTPIDEEVFMGEGDYQFDVYRLMKQHAAPHWASFNPLTNVMWLHYLVLKLLQSKRLRPPTARAGHAATTTFTERVCYRCLVEMEGLLATCISGVRQSKKPSKGQGRRKTHAPALVPSGFNCAGDVVHYGVEKGWIMPLI